MAELNFAPLADASKGGIGTVSEQSVRTAVLERTLPRLAEREGEAAAWTRVLNDVPTRAHSIGLLAENDFVERHPEWRLTRNSNAPQNDVWTWANGSLEGGQLKTHVPGRESQYARDMLKDDKADQFLVPDDQYAAVRQRIQDRIKVMEQQGDQAGVELWEQQLKRLKRLGRNYAELDRAVVQGARAGLRSARVISAARAGVAGGAIIVIVDGGSVVYRSLTGELTPSETHARLVEVGAKAGAVTMATGAVVLLGANPIGLTVIVVGGVAYLVADFAIDELRENWASTPLTAGQINALMPRGWALADAQSDKPLKLQLVQDLHKWDLNSPSMTDLSSAKGTPNKQGPSKRRPLPDALLQRVRTIHKSLNGVSDMCTGSA
jgi:hypothetical protein